MSRFVQDVEDIVITRHGERVLGGSGSGNFGHSGRPGERGGSGPGDGGGRADKETAKKAEFAKQEELAAQQTDPLARPTFVIGMDNAIGHEHERYVAAYGQRFKSQPLPADVERGREKECYKNASLLVMERSDLTYVEGFGKTARTGDLAFLHAWAVDNDGNVIDPTWTDPEKNEYFGVKYDRAKYLKYLYTAKIYGVLGSTFKNAHGAINTGGKKLR